MKHSANSKILKSPGQKKPVNLDTKLHITENIVNIFHIEKKVTSENIRKIVKLILFISRVYFFARTFQKFLIHCVKSFCVPRSCSK